MTNVTRWFTTCINQPEFLKVLGKISLCEKMVPVTAKMNTAESATSAVNTAAPATNGQTEFKNVSIFRINIDLDLPLNVFLSF